MGIFKPNVGKLRAKGDVKGLVKAFFGKSGIIREEAGRALRDMRDTRAVEPLIDGLGNENSHVRGWATVVLGEIGDRRAVEPLIQRLKDDVDVDIRERAAEALGKIKDPKAIEPLIGSFWEVYPDIGPELSSGVVEALGEIGEPAIEPLIRALRHDDRHIREGAATVLGNMGILGNMRIRNMLNARAVEPLMLALKDEDVREVAKWALEKIKMKKNRR